MKEEMENRLKVLTAEFKAGQEMLVELDSRRSNLQTTLVRISGAIQVLEELLNEEHAAHNELLPKTNGGASQSAPH